MNQGAQQDELSALSDSPRTNGRERPKARPTTRDAAPGDKDEKSAAPDFRQWQLGPNDTYRPAGLTRQALPPGTYTVYRDNWGLFLQSARVLTDDLLELPDTASESVLAGMRKFWTSRERYLEFGLLFKRGILLYGPPGGGKTATVELLCKELVAQGGVVLLCRHPGLCAEALAALRRIEPERPLVCVEEDLDEIVCEYSEHELLSLLDGENQVDNIVHIATTNYPDRLGGRIVNRPSRFDERIRIGMPSAAAREVYLRHVAGSRIAALPGGGLDAWVRDTEGLSIAHLRELTVAVLCLEQPYPDVLARLAGMRSRLKEQEGLGGAEGAGFAGLGREAGGTANGSY